MGVSFKKNSDSIDHYLLKTPNDNKTYTIVFAVGPSSNSDPNTLFPVPRDSVTWADSVQTKQRLEH